MKKHTQLLMWMLLISAVIVGGAGAYLKYAVLKPLDLCQDQSIFAVPFLLMTDETTRYALQSTVQEEAEPTEPEPDETVPLTLPPEETAEPVTEPPTEPPTEPEPVELDESWFDDALFIGDSRTQGLQNYGRLGEADYFCDVGMSVYSARSTRRWIKDVGRTNLGNLLDKKAYGKIYISLGLNEIMGDHEKLLEEYENLIDLIREKQPDCHIILQAIMTVGRNKANSKECFSLESIHGLNGDIAALVKDDKMHYIDVNEWIADEEGYLPDEWTRDGTHPYATGYAEWSQWLLENAGTLGIE